MDRHAAFDGVKCPNSWQNFRKHKNLAGRPLKPGVRFRKMNILAEIDFFSLIINRKHILFVVLFILYVIIRFLFSYILDKPIGQANTRAVSHYNRVTLRSWLDNYFEIKKTSKIICNTIAVISLIVASFNLFIQFTMAVIELTAKDLDFMSNTNLLPLIEFSNFTVIFTSILGIIAVNYFKNFSTLYIPDIIE